jgi:hypothetical protein
VESLLTHIIHSLNLLSLVLPVVKAFAAVEGLKKQICTCLLSHVLPHEEGRDEGVRRSKRWFVKFPHELFNPPLHNPLPEAEGAKWDSCVLD